MIQRVRTHIGNEKRKMKNEKNGNHKAKRGMSHL